MMILGIFMLLLVPLVAGGVGIAFIARKTERDWPELSVSLQGLVPRPVKFTGTLGGYGLLWCKVIFLNVITLGLHSPWGTVRLRKYLHTHTEVGVQRFDFIGDAMGIFKGRLLVIGAMIVFVVVSGIESVLGSIMLLLAYFVVLPWIVPRALRYRARTTTLSGVPFEFKGGWGGAFIAYVLGPIVAALTLWLAMPVVTRYSLRYRYNNLKWGGRRLAANVSLGELYKVLALSALTGLLVGALVGGLLWMVVRNEENPVAWAPLIYVLIYFGLFPAAIAYRALTLRHVLGSLVVEGVGRLRCTLSTAKAVFVACTNSLVIVLTLGLATPWAKVRWLRVLTEALVFESVQGGLEIELPEGAMPRTATDEFTASIFDVEL